MKKFLSVLLALAVAFTFTFGSTMSAFAADTEKYSMNEQKALLANAYNAAIAEAAAYNYDFDNYKYAGTSTDTDLTMVSISADAVKIGIAAAYDAVLADITGTGTSINTKIDAATAGDYDATLNNTTTSTDFTAVKKYLLDAAKATGAQASEVQKAAFGDFKAYLTGIVDSVDISIYTSTVQETKYEAYDRQKYDTAAKAAAADIATAKAIINHAKFNDAELNAAGKTTADATADWTVSSYDALYDAIIGNSLIIAVTPNYDDPISDTMVTSLTYKLVAKDRTSSLTEERPYATTKSEAAEEANEAVTKAQAKAALLAAVTTYENNNTLKADAQAQLDAYKEAMTYIIENGKPYATIYTITSVTKDGVNGVNYIRLTDAADAVKADVATKKAYYEARGYNWDDAEAAKALNTQLLAIYRVTSDSTQVASTFNPAGCYTSDLTAAMKAYYKIDYSEIEAKEVDGYNGAVYALNQKAYYEAEWTAVKAAIDTYNAAVDAAKVIDDITGAEGAAAALTAALNKIDTADEVYSDVSAASTTYESLKAYAGLAFKNAKAADSTLKAIYVTFGEATDLITADNGAGLTDTNVYLWFIDNGARTVKEAAALYAEACKVIDGYKTLSDLKAEAAAVQAQIAALPATPAVTDKDAVVAAYDAYKALHNDAKNYVTNYTALAKAIATVEKAEAYAVKAQIAALPLESKATAADKDAIEAAEKAYNDYKDTTAYKIITNKTLRTPGYSFTDALVNARTDALNSIKAAHEALNNKYVADKLTAEDAAAVEALQKALEEYIANYGGVLTEAEAEALAVYENNTAKIAAVVDAAVAEAEWTTTDVKASLFDSSRKLTIWRTSKTSIRVTSVGSVADIKDHGYTVKYKFYKKAPGSSTYKLVKTTTSNKYTYTNLKKGTNKFQVKVCVYDADGKLVASKWTYYRAAKVK